MFSTTLQVKYDNPRVLEVTPLRPAKYGDAGLDLCFSSPDLSPILVHRGDSVAVPAGVSVKIPDNYFGLITARSSTFSKFGLMVVQGIIDSGYTGPLFTNVYFPGVKNRDVNFVTVRPYQRLAQLIIIPASVTRMDIEKVDQLPITERGEDGFGSTGH